MAKLSDGCGGGLQNTKGRPFFVFFTDQHPGTSHHSLPWLRGRDEGMAHTGLQAATCPLNRTAKR